MPFKNLFRAQEKKDDGFTQTEREAVVDVLHFCMYADRHIALAEDKMIETVARTLNWDAKVSYDYYEGKSVGAVRTALKDTQARGDFLKDVGDRLKKPEHRKFVLGVADAVMKADGEKKSEEIAALGELKKALKV